MHSCTCCLIFQHLKVKRRKRNQLTVNMNTLSNTGRDGENPYTFIDDEVEGEYGASDTDIKKLIINK